MQMLAVLLMLAPYIHRHFPALQVLDLLELNILCAILAVSRQNLRLSLTALDLQQKKNIDLNKLLADTPVAVENYSYDPESNHPNTQLPRNI